MADQWYCRVSGAVCGPFSLQELRDLKRRGKLSAEDQVRQGTTRTWMPAGRIDALFPAPLQRPARSNPGAKAVRPKTPTHGTPVPSGAVPPTSRPPRSKGRSGRTGGAPPPLPTAADEGNVRNRILIGTGVGAGVVVLILLMLLLLLRGGGRGTDALAGRGIDAGRSEGSSDGSGAGPGHRSATDQAGSAADSAQAGAAEAEDRPDRADSAEEVTAEEEEAGATETPSPEEPAEDESDQDDAPEQPALPDATFALRDLPAAPEGGGAPGGRGGASGGGEFFGVKAEGRRFVYIVDSSGSMSGGPFMKASEELMGSVRQLDSRQSFYVIFFSSNSYPMFCPKSAEPDMLPATNENLDRLQRWVNQFRVGGGTRPLDAVLHGLSLNPDAIFFLSDGIFERRVVDVIRRENKEKTVINTIAFVDRSGEPLLRQIAAENRGEYRFVP